MRIGFLSEQIIQRQLEQVEEKQRQLEERGVAVEKALRGEAGIHHNLVWFFPVFLPSACAVIPSCLDFRGNWTNIA